MDKIEKLKFNTTHLVQKIRLLIYKFQTKYNGVVSQGFQKGFTSPQRVPRRFWSFRFTKKGLTTPQGVHECNEKVKGKFAFRGFLLHPGSLDGLEVLHCFNGTFVVEGLHTFV